MPWILAGVPVFEPFAGGAGCSPGRGRGSGPHCYLMRLPRRQHAIGHARARPAHGHCFMFARNPGHKKRRQHTLISFIWSPGNPLPAGTGGSENYTIGQVRELLRRGIPAQVVTIGLGTRDGRDGFTDIPFLTLSTLAKVSGLDGTIVFVNEAHTVPTRNPAFLILHNPPPIRERHRAFAVEGTRELILIATSRYAATLWADYLDVD